MKEFVLSPRWYGLKPHPEQERFRLSPARFKVVPAGRRSGKTENAKRCLVEKALEESIQQKFLDYRYFAAAPTFGQAKRIYWRDLKSLTEGLWLKKPYESDLIITLKTGAEICVLGMDKPERIEGVSWNGGILDEYANMKPHVWTDHVRPALSDRRAWCWFVGVPEGRNHYYDLYKRALNPDEKDWDAFTWISADILPPDEIEAAKRDLDELTYLQEYEASFVNFEGRVYYPYEERTHVASLRYDPRQPLIVCFDFNVAPGIAAIIQEQTLPNGLQGTGVIGEVHIPRNSNTPSVCNRLIQDWGHHDGPVHVYGDATGGSRGTAKVSGSDWDLIRDILGSHFKNRFWMRVPQSNPPERSRVNAVNSRLRSASGDIRLMVDYKAINVQKDFEGSSLLQGGSGEIDKKATPELTHLTDAIGYYIEREFPVSGQRNSVRQLV